MHATITDEDVEAIADDAVWHEDLSMRRSIVRAHTREQMNAALAHILNPGAPQPVAGAVEALKVHILHLEARLAEGLPMSESANRLHRFINSLDVDDLDERAEKLMQSQLDGMMVGPGNRAGIKSSLSDHFHDIRESALSHRPPAEETRDELAALEREIISLRAREEALEAALNFYAKPENYCSALKFNGDCGHRLDWEKTPVLVDDGAVASAALNRGGA